MSDPVQTAASQDDWLARFDAMSPDEQEEQVFALGSADAEKLLAIAEHAADDMSAAMAIDRLAELDIMAAVEPLCAMLGRVDYDSERRQALLSQLSQWDDAVLEPLLRVRATLSDDSRRDDVVVILSEREDGLPKDERVFVALCEYLTRHRWHGAELLEEYGDARAIPFLEAAIAAFSPNLDSLRSKRELKSLVSAYNDLGGHLPDELHDRVHTWLDTWKARFALPEPVRRAALKLGRNDPCRCGSGKKYKKCCLGAESTPA